MEVDFRRIYAHDADRYDRLVRAEDCEGHLASALDRLAGFRDARVLDVGTGTGRIAQIALERAASVVGLEPSEAMLEVAHRRLSAIRQDGWSLFQGDARELPWEDHRFDVGLAGWVFGHFGEWYPDRWQREVERALRALSAAVRVGGRLIVIETLGTGAATPSAPSPQLAEYHAWLEREQGFHRDEIRTDYRFASPEEAVEVLAFFFGAELVATIRSQGWARVPECTGIWWRVNE